MKNTIRFAVAGLACVLMSACTHPMSSHMSSNRFDSPEASGKLGVGDVGGGFGSGPQYTITPDATSLALDTSHPGFSHSNLDGFLAGDLGLLDSLDLGLKIRFNNTTLGQVKYQFIGDPRITAKEGNFSLAATFAGGGATHNNTDTEVGDVFLGPAGNVTATDTLSETDLDAAVIAGYRFAEMALVYGGPFWTHRKYSGNIVQTGDATANYAFSGIMDQLGWNVGIQATANIAFFKGEVAVSRVTAGPLNYTSAYIGGEFGIAW